MRIVLAFLSASLILAPTAVPQAANRTQQPQAGSNQPTSLTNGAMTDALKQFAGNGFTQDPALPSQSARPQLPRPPQVSPWTGPFSTIGPYGNGLNLGIQRQERAGTLPNSPKPCAIPLLEMAVDGTIDQGIRVGPGSASSVDPIMSVLPPAPACESQSSPQPKFKAK
jgi:hypothetical protein